MKHPSFTLKNTFAIASIKCDAYIYEHTQSGATLMYLKNDDPNKVFSASFKTPPSDHTGVPHIVEHCVLSGSRKYHTKEPFMDLVKGSMNTFINAMTFSDKTMYPVASKNDKDFYNLMDVYLDAVYFPKIHEVEEIFMQEGWRHDIHELTDPITYKGVVYNEMKGAYSDPIRSFFQLMSETLFDGTPYGFESGGHPEHITGLTYDDFKAFHKTYYHPSNSYLYLYGDLDLEAVLQHMDTEYLSHFNKADGAPVAIYPAAPLTAVKEAHGTYAISAEENLDNKDYMGLAFPLGLATDAESYMMADILSDMLIKASASPLKKALLDADLAEDITDQYNDGLMRIFSVALVNTSVAKKDPFIRIVLETLAQMVEDGIDENLKLSAINALEYKMREAGGFHTKGIIHHMTSMDSWLYCDDPAVHLNFDETFAKLRASACSGGFEAYIAAHLLGGKPYAFCSISPDPQKAERLEKQDLETLEAYKQSLSAEALETLVEKNKKLKIKQLSPDSEEALASIPRIAIADIQQKTEVFPIEIIRDLPYTLLHTPGSTSGITYVDAYFDASHFEREELPYLEILTHLLGELSTTKRSYETISTAIKLNTGGFKYQTTVLKAYEAPHVHQTRFVLSAKTTEENHVKMFDLMREVVTETQFSDVKRVKDLLSALKTQMQSDVTDSGNAFVSGRIAAYLSEADRRTDMLSGFGFYFFLNQLMDRYDADADAVLSKLQSVYSRLFSKENLVISTTCDASVVGNLVPVIDAFTDVFSRTSAAPVMTASNGELKIPINEGIKSSANVQYVGIGFNFIDQGHRYSGALQLLTTWLNGEYLHDRVRAKGGAYGCGASIDYTGKFTIASYRDPNLAETYEVYKGIADAIDALELTEDALEKLIIGTISRIDGAKTAHGIGKTAALEYLIGRTLSQKQRFRDEILTAKVSDIKQLSKMMRDLNTHGLICTLGNAAAIEKEAQRFDHVVKLNQ